MLFRTDILQTRGNQIEPKGVQFPGRDAPDKINRGSNSQSPVIARKCLIRMRSDERENSRWVPLTSVLTPLQKLAENRQSPH